MAFQKLSQEEQHLNQQLRALPGGFLYRYTPEAEKAFKEILFRSLVHGPQYWHLFFPNGPPSESEEPWSLSQAQGAVDGAEYTAAARGTACGHIFKSGESTYHCKTCAADDTCVLCARCFDSSDHDGHMVYISISPGNSGCCDCGDREAWDRPQHCAIHTVDHEAQAGQTGKDKGKATSSIPLEVRESVEMTIARAIDYLCDVFSCSPEQLRLPKSETTIRQDERMSRLNSSSYGEPERRDTAEEYALVLWNDEKHTVDDVRNQVARACSQTKKFGLDKAMQVNDVGRSVVAYSKDISALLRMAEIIEQLKVTVTIRSARDTFREGMCATIIDWLSDISGCNVGNESMFLRHIVCQELLKPWRTGSEASNQDIGAHGIDDHEQDENEKNRRLYRTWLPQVFRVPAARPAREDVEADDDAADEGNEDEDEEMDEFDEYEIEVEEGMDIEIEDLQPGPADDGGMDIDFMDDDGAEALEAREATFAGYPPPPPPPGGRRERIMTPTESDDGEIEVGQARPMTNTNTPFATDVPKTPRTSKINPSGRSVGRPTRPPKYWLEKPDGFRAPRPAEPCEDLRRRVRLDFLILYDLRMWKTLRISIRHLYITTVVTIPMFKRILGLRFAGLYTILAQLYLIADREPDHSIINLSVQMLTTPTITQEVVERGNFLTNLMAILYTFLTTRQVSFPEDVNPRATLAFDAGAVTNRRMFHFFLDLRWTFQSEFIKWRLQSEERYLSQFLDLVKLHQGICPNQRATGEHVEYESDAWISASLLIKEMNKLVKLAAAAFELKSSDDLPHLQKAIRLVAQSTMINALGLERRRFAACEIKHDLQFHHVETSDFEKQTGASFTPRLIPTYVVQREHMSFHHPLHSLLSWLFEAGKSMDRAELSALLRFDPSDLKDPLNLNKAVSAPALTSDELLCVLFDHPLRVCAWLAQMRAGMWVRNGITLRHQMHTYRGVTQRDVSYQRDIFMIQAGLVLCSSDEEPLGSRFLAQMIDRFEMSKWVSGDYSVSEGYEEQQQLDVIEDFFHLLVVALSDRSALIPNLDPQVQHLRSLKLDVAHALCFKPLSYSELTLKVTDRVADSQDFQTVLEQIATFRAPEGLSDTGTFELKPEYIETLNPYYAHYTRNHREEAENIYKAHMAKKLRKDAADIVFEPRLESIPSGLFTDLAAFTTTPLFAQTIYHALRFISGVRVHAPKLQVTRIETFLHIVLHLILLAVLEDKTTEEEEEQNVMTGFIKLALNAKAAGSYGHSETIVSLLASLSGSEDYALCAPNIKHILRSMQQHSPRKLSLAIGPLEASLRRADTGSPASISSEDKEKKKQASLQRQARVMAQMKQQQNSFLETQGLAGFEEDLSDYEDAESMMQGQEANISEKKLWHFPSGTCILCQEETDEQRLSGTFAYMGESNILRPTPMADAEFVEEVINTPSSLDLSADHIRPFGVASKNRKTVQKVASDGTVVDVERQALSRGYPQPEMENRGPVATSCGHIMHYSCFELYLAATQRRHTQQIARNHPERPEKKEFICPLCKALGNTFLPIVWKPKECESSYQLQTAQSFSEWLNETSSSYLEDYSFLDDAVENSKRMQQKTDSYSESATQYVAQTFTPTLVEAMQDMSLSTVPSPSSQPAPARRGFQLPPLLRFRHDAHRDTPVATETSAGLEQQPRAAELVKAYKRIDETLKVNALAFLKPEQADDMRLVQPLSMALGLSISSVEIAHRGVESPGLSLLEDLPEHTVTHLRILSETIASYIAVGNLRGQGSNATAETVIRKHDRQRAQLFGSRKHSPEDLLEDFGALCEEETFLFFADWVAYMTLDPSAGSSSALHEAYGILRICYWAEIVKVIHAYCRSSRLIESDAARNAGCADETIETRSDVFDQAVVRILAEHHRHVGGYENLPDLTRAQLQKLRVIVEKYALPFLRKSMILMHVRFGIDFASAENFDFDAPELSRLTALLGVPSLDDMFKLYNADVEAGENLRKITHVWIDQACLDFVEPNTILLSHPAIFELVGLPKNYDTLSEEAIRRRCPTTGKEVTDPAVCLFCGDVFCSQAVCCMKDRSKGGCFQHMQKCGGNIGIFLNIRKCMVLFMHGTHGSFTNAPYLDKHGEPDPTMRRHHQLYLNQKRYDKLLRDVWLNHMIPSVISRKLEGDMNPGGWETL